MFNYLSKFTRNRHCSYVYCLYGGFVNHVNVPRPCVQFIAYDSRRWFSGDARRFSEEVESTKALLQKTSHDFSYVNAANLKEATHRLHSTAPTSAQRDASKELISLGEAYEKAILQLIDARSSYNKAMQTKVADDSNIKFGVVGVGLFCIFASLSVSLHPLFLVGCCIGAYFYKPVFRQSVLRERITSDMEHYLTVSKECRKELTQLHSEIVKLIEQLQISANK